MDEKEFSYRAKVNGFTFHPKVTFSSSKGIFNADKEIKDIFVFILFSSADRMYLISSAIFAFRDEG